MPVHLITSWVLYEGNCASAGPKRDQLLSHASDACDHVSRCADTITGPACPTLRMAFPIGSPARMVMMVVGTGKVQRHC